MVNENRLGLATNPWGVLAPAIVLAILAVGTNVFADALARAAFGDGRRRRGTAVTPHWSDDSMTACPNGACPDESEQHRRRDGLVVEGLTVVTEGRGTPVVEDISFEVAARPGPGSGGRVRLRQEHRRRRASRLGPPGSAHRRRPSVASAASTSWRCSGKELQDARGRLVAYVPQDPASGLNPGAAGRPAAARGDHHPRRCPRSTARPSTNA